MSKFEKRLSKLGKRLDHAIVIGSGFGQLEELLQIFKTVFVIGGEKPTIKSKNLVYRENFENLYTVTNVNHIFYDLNKIDQLENLKDYWTKNKSLVLIEGNDPIEREFSKSLYASGWRCTSLQGTFHVWEEYK